MESKNVVDTASCNFHFDSEGILRIKIKPGARINEAEVKRVFAAIREISSGKKVLELMEGSNFYTYDQAAQRYAALHGKELFIASAIVLKSTGMRLLFNFYTLFFPQEVPFRMFHGEKAALKWLREFIPK